MKFIFLTVILCLGMFHYASASVRQTESEFAGVEWYEAEKTLPKSIRLAIDKAITVLESAVNNLEGQIKKKEKSGSDSSVLEEKLELANSVLDALDSVMIYYSSKKSGDCAAVSVEGEGTFYPTATQYNGSITICPPAMQAPSQRALVTLILHESVHQADELSGNLQYQEDSPRAIKAYECSTDARAVELYRLGTGTNGVWGYNCK